MVAQGDLWWLETPNDKRRPVVVVTRNEALSSLNNVVVAPVTSAIRPIPTCLPVGAPEGLDHDSVANFDQLASVPKSLLTVRIGNLSSLGHARLCQALQALADCPAP